MADFGINSLETLGILFICGFFGGKLASRLKFPRVTGYILAGMLLSPSVTGILPAELVEERFAIVTDMALAIIAFSIGGSLNLAKLKVLGKSILWINVTEALGAFLLTFLAVAGLSPLILGVAPSPDALRGIVLPLALIIGAVSAATAPAAVLAVVHECRARGPLTTTLLGVVALDDGMAVILYTFAITLVGALTQVKEVAVLRMIGEPSLILLGSVLLGGLVGLALTAVAPWVKSRESLLVVILGGLLLCTGIALHAGLSPLLADMLVGLVVINRARQSQSLFDAVDAIEEPLFALFFTLAGAHFDVAVIKMAGLLAVLISLCRFTGKLLGTRLGARFSSAPAAVRKYLGYGLLPTAGVTIGLVLMAQPFEDPGVFDIMINAVLGSVAINEVLGPPLVKYALLAAGEGVGG